MTDLRSALIEACDLAETLYTEFHELEPVRRGRTMVDASDAPDTLARLRSLATSPLCVLDALRDPEVRAGRVWIDAPAIGAKLRCTDGGWVQEDAGLGWRRWHPCASDLDSPCRLVPAEGDHG